MLAKREDIIEISGQIRHNKQVSEMADLKVPQIFFSVANLKALV
jgi:hypothetical protein